MVRKKKRGLNEKKRGDSCIICEGANGKKRSNSCDRTSETKEGVAEGAIR